MRRFLFPGNPADHDPLGWAFFIWLFLLAPSLALAQTATGRISGTVLDPADLAIEGAQVTVRSEASGAATTARTHRSGGFTFLDLPAGRYAVEVDAPGFRRHVVRNVKVDVASETSLPPIRLELGEVTEIIEVQGGVHQVQTTHAELTATVTTEQIEHLPLIGRDPLVLIALEAGVAFAGANPTVINGQRTSFSNVTLDGINIQDNFIRDNALDFLPTRTLLDQVAEFTITTQNGNAATGGGSSQVSFTTRSGTNEFHGNLYWHNRNSKFSAAEWFSNRNSLPKPFLNWNQGGGSLGGPIVRNRLLFYTNYETYRQREESLVNGAILTPEARQGIFTYRDLNGRVQKINVLRAAGAPLSPEAEAILARIPPPDQINNFDVGDSDRELLRNTAGYRFLAQNNRDRDASTSRLDWILSDSHWLSGTYKYVVEDGDRPDAGIGFHRVPVVRDFNHSHFTSIGWRWSPNPSWSNELRGGFHLAPGDFRTTENRGSPLLTGFLFTNPVVNFDPEGRNTDTLSLANNAAYQHGNHSFRFGGSGQWVYVESFDSAGALPTFLVDVSLDSRFAMNTRFFPGGVSTGDFNAAHSLLASLAGLVRDGAQVFNIRDRNSGFVPGAEFRRRYSFNNHALYGQDSWRISPKLTLNLGLRWEYLSRFNEADSLMLAPVAGTGGIITTLLSDATLDFAGGDVDRNLYARDLNNFAPNVGIAYDLFGDGKTALRAGYSINYVIDEIVRASDNATSANAGLQAVPLLQNLDLTLSDPLPAIEPPEFRVPRRVSENLAVDPSTALFAVDPNLRTPYVQQWHFGIQREIAKETVVDLRYVGNKGTKLLRGFDFNQVVIRENGFLEDFLRARSNGFLSMARRGEFDPTFNPAIAGSQPLTFFPRLDRQGALQDPLVQALIRSGEPGELAALYVVNRLTEGTGVRFRRNPNTFVADLITNISNSSYHAFQAEVRRRAAAGILFQANYTFGKVLTDSSGGVARFDPFLDIHQPQLERARADFDLNHVFNANFVWPLPFGAGHRWSYAPLERLINGWTVSSILTWQSGAPLSILSGRGTLNRTTRSGENTAMSSLTKEEIEDIIGFRMTEDGPFFVAASAIHSADNRGVAPDGEAPFAGQVFFHPQPGEAGNLQRRMFSGPSAFSFDLALDKSIRFKESQSILFGTKITNVLNHPAFFAGSQSIGSTQFGRITGVLVSARVIEFQLRYSF